MSSGRTHALGSVVVSPLAFLSTIEAGMGSGQALLAMASCAILGVLITPDLDQQTKSWVENSLMKNRNIIIAAFGWIHYAFWYPYASRIAHRHWLSHAPIIGTIVRVCYVLAFVLSLLWLASNEGVALPQVDKQGLVNAVLSIVWGLMVSDTTHWLFDTVSTPYRRLKRALSPTPPRKRKATRKTVRKIRGKRTPIKEATQGAIRRMIGL